MLEWKCPVSRAKGVLLQLACVCLPGDPLPPVHFMQAYLDVLCGEEVSSDKRVSVDNVTQLLQDTRVLSNCYVFTSSEFVTGMLWGG